MSATALTRQYAKDFTGCQLYEEAEFEVTDGSLCMASKLTDYQHSR